MIDPATWPLLRRLTPRQYEILAYLAVGGWNTLFGLGVYALSYRWFGQKIHYLLLGIPCSILAITNAFICYKIVVFRTRGNWLREYLRVYVVYGSGMLSGFLQMIVWVELFHIHPVIANCIVTALNIVLSYIGHKYFSFRKSTPGGPKDAAPSDHP